MITMMVVYYRIFLKMHIHCIIQCPPFTSYDGNFARGVIRLI